jgi:hypothetical protein
LVQVILAVVAWELMGKALLEVLTRKVVVAVQMVAMI